MNKSEQTDALFAALSQAQAGKNPDEEDRVILQMKGRQKSTPAKPKSHIASFIKKVRFGLFDCWYWAARRTSDGYGATEMMGEWLAHRVSWRLFNGVIPEGLCVLHRCDVRACVNPDHLFLGSQNDNTQDMVSKNRHHKPIGARNFQAKLSELQARQIRQQKENGVNYKQLTKDFGVSISTIYRVIRGESWSMENV